MTDLSAYKAWPWVVVSTASHIDAISQASRESHRPIIAATPPGAVAWLGPGWLPSLLATCPESPLVLPLADCGDAVGYALASLDLGVGVIVPEAPLSARHRLESIGRTLGRLVLAERQPGLDLRDCRDPLEACRGLLLPRTNPLAHCGTASFHFQESLTRER